MKYLIGIVGAATLFATSALVFAQTTRPTTPPTVQQATVDAAMERLQAKQAAGPSLEERLSKLERKVAALESQNKRIAELEAQLAAATKQIDQLVHSQAPPAAAQPPNAQVPKAEPGGLRTWQCWVSLKKDVAGSGRPYRDYVEASSYSEASEMFRKKHPNENIAQVEEKRP